MKYLKDVMSRLVNQGFESYESISVDDPPPPEELSGECALLATINIRIIFFEDNVLTFLSDVLCIIRISY